MEESEPGMTACGRGEGAAGEAAAAGDQMDEEEEEDEGEGSSTPEEVKASAKRITGRSVSGRRGRGAAMAAGTMLSRAGLLTPTRTFTHARPRLCSFSPGKRVHLSALFELQGSRGPRTCKRISPSSFFCFLM